MNSMEDQAQRLREMVEAANKGRNMHEEDKKAAIYCITSGKGGVGKTSFTVNLALALANCGKKTLIIDGDFGFSNVNILLGKNAKYNLQHVISGEKRLSEVMEECFPNVWYISGGSGVTDLVKLKGKQLEDIMGQLLPLEDQMDYILFDTGAGINSNILRMIDASDETILVITPEPTSIVDSYVVTKTAEELEERPVLSVLINKVSSEKEAMAIFQNFSRVVEKNLENEVKMLGYIPADSRLVQSVSAMIPHLIQYPTSAAALQIQRIATTIAQGQEQIPAKGLKSFLKRLLKGDGQS